MPSEPHLGSRTRHLIERREPLDQHADHAARRVDLTAVLPLGTGELHEEIFVDAAQVVLLAFLGIAQPDRPDHVDQRTQAVLVKRLLAKIL